MRKWVSEDWQDYELIDCTGREKLERWGEYLIRRPELGATEKHSKSSIWNKVDARFSESGDKGGSWQDDKLPKKWRISYKDLLLYAEPMSFKHMGIFPEQAANWDYTRSLIETAGRPVSILNLFAYTGASTIAALKSGASVCHVDSSRPAITSAKDNLILNSLEYAPVRWILDDCKKFVLREIKRGSKYDAVIMDPPSFGRGKNSEIWRIQDELFPFCELCSELLSENPLFFLINTYSPKINKANLEEISDKLFLRRFGGKSEIRELALPISSNGKELVCGVTMRWTK